MRHSIIGLTVGLLIGFVVAAFVAPAPGDTQITGTQGAGDGGTVVEDVVWKNADGKSRKATFQRAVVKIPLSYGELRHVTNGEMWFLDEKGGLRNVLVGTRLVIVQRGE